MTPRPGPVALLALGLLGCAAAPVALEPAAPEPSPRVRLVEGVPVGPYRVADVRGVAGSQRFYFAPGGTCGELLGEGAAFYLPEGRFGSLVARADGPRCAPVGVADLESWRDGLPQRRSRYLVPREPATLRPAGTAPGLLLVRGSLPLAIELRIPGPGDLVAVVPDDPACRSLLAARSGMLEYRSQGPDPLVLRGREGPCPIRGLALPLSLE